MRVSWQKQEIIRDTWLCRILEPLCLLVLQYWPFLDCRFRLVVAEMVPSLCNGNVHTLYGINLQALGAFTIDELQVSSWWELKELIGVSCH